MINEINIESLFKENFKFETENLTLRLPNINTDKASIQEILSEKEIQNNYCSNYHVQLSTDKYIEWCIEQYQQRKAFCWVIERKSDKQVLGLRDFFILGNNRPIEVQGCIKRAYQRQGVTSEIYINVFRRFEKYGAYIYHAKTNSRSIKPVKMLYKLGFRAAHIMFNSPSPANGFKGYYSTEWLKNQRENNTGLYEVLNQIDEDINFFIFSFLRPQILTSVKHNGSFYEFEFPVINVEMRNKRVYKFGYDEESKSIINLREGKLVSVVSDDINHFFQLYDYCLNNMSEVTETNLQF